MESEFVWTTRDGQELLLSEIGDRHLGNILKMIRREISAAWRASGMMQGEMALISVDRDIDGMERDYGVLMVEMNRRKGGVA